MSQYPEVGPKDARPKCHHADDHSCETVERAGQSTSDTQQMQIAHVQNDIVERTFPSRRTHDNLPSLDLHCVGEHVALLFDVIEELKPMQGRFDENCLWCSSRRRRGGR